MRDLTFKGKRKDTGAWIEGYPVANFYTNKYYIVSWENGNVHYEVYPNTVVQYTGKRDKNRNRVFEGDLLQDSHNLIIVISYENTSFVYKEIGLIDSKGDEGICIDDPDDGIDITQWQIIGNMFDSDSCTICHSSFPEFLGCSICTINNQDELFAKVCRSLNFCKTESVADCASCPYLTHEETEERCVNKLYEDVLSVLHYLASENKKLKGESYNDKTNDK